MSFDRMEDATDLLHKTFYIIYVKMLFFLLSHFLVVADYELSKI